jgi:lipopolysaccharide/colanic/teichoic acid biosynthesis glycosyltransferase
MTNLEINSMLVRRFLALQYPLGRWAIWCRFQWRQLCWHWLVAGAEIAKRALDMIASFLALLLLAPFMGLIALFIKLDGGPVFFTQTRVGKFGREFKMFKYRSMCLDAEKRLQELLARNQHSEGVTFKIINDPRITRIGRLLRKFSLDELPQLYNVLIGDMSLVGPRPPVPREVALYSLPDRRRLLIKPGITCIWQVSGRSEIDFSGQVLLDVEYIETQNFWVDIKILAKTVPAVLSGKGAC